MKKLNKLFAILIAVLGVGSLSAQTNIIADWDGGSNTGKPTTFGWASSYGSRSWGALNGSGARVTNNYSGYTKEDGSKYTYVKDSEPSTQILWIRYNSNSETYTYTFSGLEAGKIYTFSGLVGWHNNSNAPTFTITVNGDKELAKVSKYCGTRQKLYPFSVDFMVPADNQSTNFTLKFNCNQGGDCMEALSALSIVENTAFANASQENPYDMTSWLANPSFEESTSSNGNSVNVAPGWTFKCDLSGWLDGSLNTSAPSEGSKCYNLWAGTVNSIDVYQTVNLPAGKYRVSADLRTDAVGNITNQGVYANIGGIITKSGTIQTVASTWNSLEGWNTLTTTFNNGSAGEVTIGISSTGNGGSSGWFQVDNVRLLYYGYDLSEALNALNALVATAQGIIDANEVSPQSVLNLQAAIEAANSVQQTEAAIAEASTALTEAINAANATIAVCNEYKSMLALSEGMYTNSTADDKSTFEAAINKAKSDFSTAANVDAIRTIVIDLQNAQKAYCLVASPAEGHPFDMTFLVVNPNFDEGKNGWTSDGGAQNKQINNNKPEPITGNFYENWNGSAFTGSIYQEISGLPKGTYRLRAAAFGNEAALFANDATTLMANNDNTPAWYEVEVKVNDGTLKFGVQNNNNTQWMGIDNVTLLFISGLDLSEFISSYEAALNNARLALENKEYENITGIERSKLEETINQTVEETKESYLEATSALENATQTFINAKADYDILAGEITIARGLGMTDDAINAVTSGKTGALAYTDLKVAEYTYIMSTYTEEAPIGDWTSGFDKIDGQSYDGSNTKYYDKWGDGTFVLKQTVTLPKGDYALSVIARGQSGASGTLYYKIGDATTSTNLIMKGDIGLGVDVNGAANFSAEGSYSNNNAGRGWEYRFITFHLDNETQVEIGVSAKVNWQWASTYAPKLYTDPSSKKALLLTEIENLLDNVPSGYMNAEVESTLVAKKAIAQSANNTNTTEELNVIYAEFKAAVDAANTSIAAYEKLAHYISMTEIFTDVTAYQQKYNNGQFTTDEVESVRQELNVMRFNAASEIFPNKIEVTGWEGSMGGKNTSGQHWDGNDTKYYDNNSWNGNAHSTMTSIELPKGTYVLKAALRSSANTTLTLTVLDQIVNVEGKGDTGYGVDTSGAANFSDPKEENTYANNNAGRGWEWEFVKFELEETTTVTLKVECNYNGVYGWASFSDITLWMDDATYVTVYGKELDAPLAEAKALVNTLPMGEAENTALANAIATGEGKLSGPAELNAAVKGLQDAVANAKSWVAAYNEEKALLVAALERFEADYNDAENGASRKMSNAAWSNVLAMVQAAAIAKDVTYSYDGFADATKDLNDVLDAAQTSINMYANFAAEISYAKGYTPIVAGNVDAHNAAITAAENAYKDAKIDDASELISAMQNFRTLDYEHVKGTYTSEVTLGNWSGKTNQSEKGKSEHWSGDVNKTYFDYSKWAPEHNNGANEATQTIKLPAGKYVLMAAGRAATVAGTEAYIKVNDTKVNFAAKGAYGYGIATDGTANFAATEETYARNNEGYGWEYRFIEFTLEAETEVTLVAGMTIDVNTADLSWASVCTPVLYTTAIDAAKQNLQDAITTAQKALGAYPVGEDAFKVSAESKQYVELEEAIATAQDVLDNAATVDELNDAIVPLNTAVSNYNDGYVLNAPKEGVKYQIAISYAGYRYNGSAFAPNADPTTGIAVPVKNNSSNVNYWNDFTFTPVNDIRNGYTISITSVDGTTYYMCTGKQENGSDENQIRMTTNPEKALTLVVKATTTDGIYNLLNTRANNATIGCQDDRNTDGGLYTTNAHNTITITEAVKAEVTLKISFVGWATLILPFNAELPEGVVAYESNGVEDDAVQLVKAESLVANTPYLIKGTEGTYKFSGYGLATEDSYTKNLFVGTYVQIKAEVGSYVLQNPKDDEGNPRGLGFYLVGEGKQPTVGAYRSYMKYTPAEGQAASPMFRIGGSTGIDNTTLPSSEEIVIYDLMGRKVTTMEKGNMYIINGRKVIVK